MIIDIDKLQKDMQNIMGEWDGDNPGRVEDRAMLAKDINTMAGELEGLINQLNNDDF